MAVNSEYLNGSNSGTAIAWYQNVKKPLVFIAKTSKWRGASRWEPCGSKEREAPYNLIQNDKACKSLSLERASPSARCQEDVACRCTCVDEYVCYNCPAGPAPDNCNHFKVLFVCVRACDGVTCKEGLRAV